MELATTTTATTATTAKIVLAIVGSRGFNDYARLCRELFKLFPQPTEQISKVVSGGANGADKLGVRWANEQGIASKEFIPEWKRRDGSTNRGAGLQRNTDIIEAADVVVAFWSGISPGTRDSIEKATARNKVVHVVKV